MLSILNFESTEKSIKCFAKGRVRNIKHREIQNKTRITDTQDFEEEKGTLGSKTSYLSIKLNEHKQGLYQIR